MGIKRDGQPRVVQRPVPECGAAGIQQCIKEGGARPGGCRFGLSGRAAVDQSLDLHQISAGRSLLGRPIPLPRAGERADSHLPLAWSATARSTSRRISAPTLVLARARRTAPSSHFSWSAWRPRSSSLINTLAVMCRADTRVNALFIIHHSHAPDGRGYWGNRPRPEQPQLNPTSTAENEYCRGSARRYCTGELSRQQGAMDGST